MAIWFATSVVVLALFDHVLRGIESAAGLSYDAAAAVTAVILLGVWTLPSIVLFLLPCYTGLTCGRCGRFQTPLRFPSYALEHGRCPKCGEQAFEDPLELPPHHA